MNLGLSIIIPAFNEEKVIAGTLRQFLPHRIPLRQDAAAAAIGPFPLEVIVSDDASTDRTADIAGPLADRVVRNPGVPRGRSGALNRGAAVARYPNLLFLDADLRLEPLPVFLEEVRDHFAPDPLVVGGMIDFHVQPEVATRADQATHALWNMVMRGVLASTGVGISTPGFQMAKSPVFRAIGGFDASLRLTQDVDFSLRLSRRGRFHYFRRCRIHESPRRYRDEGYFVYAWRSSLRWMSILLRHRSFGVYKCIR
jgi:glycosyltransferase involved in cell wall biosynthesis